jgi:hypothetical protein
MRSQWPTRRRRHYVVDTVTGLEEADGRCLDIALMHEQVFAPAVGEDEAEGPPDVIRLYRAKFSGCAYNNLDRQFTAGPPLAASPAR